MDISVRRQFAQEFRGHLGHLALYKTVAGSRERRREVALKLDLVTQEES
jgi:hypothetical protein